MLAMKGVGDNSAAVPGSWITTHNVIIVTRKSVRLIHLILTITLSLVTIITLCVVIHDPGTTVELSPTPFIESMWCENYPCSHGPDITVLVDWA